MKKYILILMLFLASCGPEAVQVDVTPYQQEIDSLLALTQSLQQEIKNNQPVKIDSSEYFYITKGAPTYKVSANFYSHELVNWVMYPTLPATVAVRKSHVKMLQGLRDKINTYAPSEIHIVINNSIRPYTTGSSRHIYRGSELSNAYDITFTYVDKSIKGTALQGVIKVLKEDMKQGPIEGCSNSLFQYLIDKGVRGIGLYDFHVHLDYRDSSFNSKWGEIPYSTWTGKSSYSHIEDE